MTAPADTQSLKPDYGLATSRMHRFAVYGGVVCVIAGRMLSERGVMGQLSWLAIAGAALMGVGVVFFVAGSVMLWSSRFGKVLLRNAMLNSISWRGDEQVLDVGCGRGLVLVSAAKRLESGRAVGIDVWAQTARNHNNSGTTMENARREGVAERIELKTADARQLPFPEASFDVIVSSLAIHNINDTTERENAIREMARVLKPGGQLAIADIRHTQEYEKVLHSLGWQQAQRWPRSFLLPARVVRGTKPTPDANA